MFEKNKIEFINNLINALYELFKEDEKEAKEFLDSENIDVEEFDKEYDLFIRKLLGKAQIAMGKENSIKKMELFNIAISKMKEMGAEAVSKILTTKEVEDLNFALYRNLECEIDEDAKNEILNDERILKIIEKLNK